MRRSTYDVGKLGFSDQILCLSSHELLLKGDQLGAGRLLVLQLGNLIGDLSLVVATGLDAALGVSDLLQDASVVLEVLCIQVFLLTDLGQQDANLVGQIRDGVVVGRLTPVGQLRRDGNSLATSCLVGTNGMVLSLDQLEELLGELGFSHATKGGHGEAVLGDCAAAVILSALAAYRQCSVHFGCWAVGSGRRWKVGSGDSCSGL